MVVVSRTDITIIDNHVKTAYSTIVGYSAFSILWSSIVTAFHISFIINVHVMDRKLYYLTLLYDAKY